MFTHKESGHKGLVRISLNNKDVFFQQTVVKVQISFSFELRDVHLYMIKISAHLDHFLAFFGISDSIIAYFLLKRPKTGSVSRLHFLTAVQEPYAHLQRSLDYP